MQNKKGGQLISGTKCDRNKLMFSAAGMIIYIVVHNIGNQ